ncbi:NAD-dependent dehydratase [Clostridium sp.]|uniref:NAD-dependent dehydratase n=1 Tax=Clostridium sp. TaxID=1506 RepID=UPI003F34B181
MLKKVVLLGSDDWFLVYFSKYLILNGSEVYIIVKKDDDVKVLDNIGNGVIINRYDGNIDHLALFFKSIDADIVYNLSYISKDNKEDVHLNEMIYNNYLFILDILEALTESSKTKFVNLVDKKDLDENGVANDIYSAIGKSMETIINHYVIKKEIKAVELERSGDTHIDMENLIEKAK